MKLCKKAIAHDIYVLQISRPSRWRLRISPRCSTRRPRTLRCCSRRNVTWARRTCRCTWSRTCGRLVLTASTCSTSARPGECTPARCHEDHQLTTAIREKIVLAARIIAAVDNPADIAVISARPYGQRAVLKFAAHTGASAIAGRFTPGNFTNYITRSFKEPRLIIVTDPRTDAQAIKEASYVNIPVIALCDTDSPTEYVDVAIPTNNKGRHAIGLIWWMLAREVLRLRGTLATRETEWDMMVDLYFYRDPEAEENKDSAGAEEEKVPGVDEVGTQAVDQGFAGNAEWELSGGATAGAFTAPAATSGAAAANASWEAEGTDWAAAPAKTGNGAAAPANDDVQW